MIEVSKNKRQVRVTLELEGDDSFETGSKKPTQRVILKLGEDRFTLSTPRAMQLAGLLTSAVLELMPDSRGRLGDGG